MDSSWAVVIGAGIALVGSVLAPWIKDALDRSHRTRESNRAAVSASLLRIAASAPECAVARIRLLRASDPSDRFGLSLLLTEKTLQADRAVFELGLLLTKKDGPMETMARLVVNAAEGDHPTIELVRFTQASARWYRGELGAKEALNDFQSKTRKDRQRISDLESAEDAALQGQA